MPDNEVTTTDADSRATIARLTAETLPRLIERLTRSQLGELEVREDGWRIRLRRPLAAQADAAAAANQARTHAATAHASGHGDRSGSTHRPPQQTRSDSARGMVTSPGVGYFVARDSVKDGSTVRRGDLVGHVDVLGVRQEIVAPIDGTLREIEVEAGQAIEYGQPIARVEAG